MILYLVSPEYTSTVLDFELPTPNLAQGPLGIMDISRGFSDFVELLYKGKMCVCVCVCAFCSPVNSEFRKGVVTAWDRICGTSLIQIS